MTLSKGRRALLISNEGEVLETFVVGIVRFCYLVQMDKSFCGELLANNPCPVVSEVNFLRVRAIF